MWILLKIAESNYTTFLLSDRLSFLPGRVYVYIIYLVT